ncbi:secretion protein SctD [Paraburkholderia sp. NMBU_R16]|uniref:HrpD5 family protein n=1 Tax=Paraburkholderia sp. NMBU_R16 TaxID=2698676 RepID=UPI0015651BFD|nr:HrpD5 family protein [Paraburkholderia sp. NMBU_R16]NRO98866.1 secretion protein SctD [Paraburkholderia sp. NMBU_R16]
MKALRILTGAHAGAQIRLIAGEYLVGAGQDADICISDWQTGALTVAISEDGATRVRMDSGRDSMLSDFSATLFGDVALCVGPDDAAWPRDLDLLANLWKSERARNDEPPKVMPKGVPPRQSKAKSPKLSGRAAAAVVCAVTVCALSVAGLALTGGTASEAAGVRPTTDQLARQVDGALHSAGMVDLMVAGNGNHVMVHGIVATAADSEKARHIVDVLAGRTAEFRYDVADEVADNIRESLGDTGAEVQYTGRGVFRISGSVRSISDFQQRIGIVRADLDSNVKRIELNVREARVAVPNTEYTSVVASGGLSYVQTPDGIKHFFDSLLGKDHEED